jgi:hypothetical protein
VQDLLPTFVELAGGTIDGGFCDLQNDLAEEQRIPVGQGSAEAEAARKQYETVLQSIFATKGKEKQ